MNRRRFFRATAGEVADALEGFQEGLHYQLAELPTLEDEQFGAIRPVIHPEVLFEEKEGKLYGYTLEDDVGTFLFDISALNSAILSSFDGQRSIKRIAKQLAASMHLDPAATFAAVKDVFLLLVRQSICVPR